MKFEIINQHDQYTMTAPDFVTALAAIALIGEGKYGVRGNGFDSGLGLFGDDFPRATYKAAGITGFNDLFHIKHGRLQTDSAFNEAVALACCSIAIRGKRSSTVDLRRLGKEIGKAVRGLQKFSTAEAKA